MTPVELTISVMLAATIQLKPPCTPIHIHQMKTAIYQDYLANQGVHMPTAGVLSLVKKTCKGKK